MAFALVTGASAGIGVALAVECARDGLDVVLTGRNQAALERVAQVIRSMGRKAVTIAQDLSEPGSAAALHEAIHAHGIAIDVLINNAGFGTLGLFWETPEEEQMRMVQVNVAALTHRAGASCPP